jgi:hypothetical protein
LCDCLGLWQHNAGDNYNCTWSSCHPTGVPAALPDLHCICTDPYVLTIQDQAHCVLGCLHGGTFDANRAACLCPTGWSGTVCSIPVQYDVAITNNATGGSNGTSGGNVTVPVYPTNNGTQVVSNITTPVTNVTAQPGTGTNLCPQ